MNGGINPVRLTLRPYAVDATEPDNVPTPPTAPPGIAPELPAGAEPGDLGAVQRSWELALAALLERWREIVAAWREWLLDRIEFHVAASDVVSLALLSVDATDGAVALEEAMTELGADAAGQVVDEAKRQGVKITAAPHDKLWTASTAQVWAEVLADVITGSATAESLRVWPGRTGGTEEGRRVRELVAAHLDARSDATERKVLGGALTAAQHDGRVRTMVGAAGQGADSALYADEVLDTNTCKRCREINRKWLGNASTDVEQVLRLYPVQGYVACLGGVRCRGQVVAVWRGGTDWRKWVELPEQRR